VLVIELRGVLFSRIDKKLSVRPLSAMFTNKKSNLKKTLKCQLNSKKRARPSETRALFYASANCACKQSPNNTRSAYRCKPPNKPKFATNFSTCEGAVGKFYEALFEAAPPTETLAPAAKHRLEC
jgi:hypothetical protein